jgi:EAL domain-containing protein (putative c-di-GMP-specific phosphodiesterase class I)
MQTTLTDLERYRLTVSKVFVTILWLLVPALCALARSNHVGITIFEVAGVSLAMAATIALLASPYGIASRVVIGAAMTGAAMLVVYAGAGPWQVDYHMAFFAVISMLAAYADWRPIVLAGLLMPLHHVAFGRFLPSTAGDAGDPGRLIVQVAFIASQCIFLIWLTSRLEKPLVQAEPAETSAPAYQHFAQAAPSVDPARAEALKALIASHTIDVALQPIWDLAEDRLLGFESLARPALRYGFNGPSEAFELAERMRLIDELDAMCRDAALARGHELPGDTLVFINISPTTFERRLLPGSMLADLALASGISPERVVLEITERSSANLDDVIDEATRLRGLGFKLALDDTGAGNAGLGMLSQMTVDFVKIDREVTAKVSRQRSARGVFAGIVAIARETGAYLIAEGIEDPFVLSAVLPLMGDDPGIVGIQGYLVGRPSLAIPDEGARARYETAIRRRLAIPRRTAATPAVMERFA